MGNTTEEDRKILAMLSKKQKAGLLSGTYQVVGVKIPLEPLVEKISIKELREKAYIRDSIKFDKGTKSIGETNRTLYMPKPKKLRSNKRLQEILRLYPELRGLKGMELFEKAERILPSREMLDSVMIRAIINSEEGTSDSIPTKVNTSTIGFYMDFGSLYELCYYRTPGGWERGSDRESYLNREIRSDGYTLYLATSEKYFP